MATVNHAYPLDSIVNYDGNGVPSFDRAVSSMVLRNLIHGLFTDGILMPENSTAMQVVENSNMTVKVNAGFCIIQGAMRTFADKTLSVTAAHTTLDRIDTVVARLNLNQDVRDILLYVVAGTPAENPTRPTLTRTDSVYELGLADLFISAGTTTIPQARITDTRLDTARCGVVSSVSEFDTSAFYDQIQSDLAHFKNVNEADFATWSSGQKSAFETWFATIKDILDSDTAGHLQLEIDTLQSGLSALETDVQNDVSAINTRLGKELTSTLTAGQTTIAFTDSAITTNTIVDNVVASVQGVTYESIEITEGVLTMTFDEQAVNVSIKVVIR